MSLSEYYMLSSNEEIILKLKEKRLIPFEAKCEGSDKKTHPMKNMRFVPRTDSHDGYSWRCNFCGTRRSIRANSFFEYSRLKLITLLKLMVHFVLLMKFKGNT